MEEQWATIAEFPQYMVSTYGVIVNKYTGRALRQSRTTQGALKVTLRVGEESLTRAVKNIVATAFVPRYNNPRFDTPIHIDNDQENCRADNLDWRPRWFAVQYSRQFSQGYKNFESNPIVDMETGDQYENVKAACLKHGLLGSYVVKSIHEGTPCFPTNQVFCSLAAWFRVDI